MELPISWTVVRAEVSERAVRLSGDPSAEVLTREVWDAIERALPRGTALERVTVMERPGCESAITRGRR